MDSNSKTITSASLTGNALLRNARYNKDTGFTIDERKVLKLEGLLPPVVDTLETQVKRVQYQLSEKSAAIDKYLYMMSLLDRNETLFYKTLMSDPADFLPVIYSPTIGEACLKFSDIYRTKAGMYITLRDKGSVKEVLRNWPEKNVRFICVSTGGHILSLGDLGSNGMGIPLGKLQLYTACAAIPPYGLLPVLLDCGTDNETLLNDPFYIGLRQRRPAPDIIEELIEEFVEAVQEIFPKCCIHFEDWKGPLAIHTLNKYKDKVCCFNGDIQGTAAIALAGLIESLRMLNLEMKNQKVMVFGAGSAGIGLAGMIARATQQAGLTEQQALSNLYLFDGIGLIESSRTDLQDYQKIYAHPMTGISDLAKAIDVIKPNVLIGVSSIGKAFTQAVIEAMCQYNERPIIFAMSNPTDHSECTAEEAFEWSDGKAVFAAGVPFAPVQYKGQTFYPGQANNFYCFPGVALAVYATKPKLTTDEFWIESAQALCNLLTPEERSKNMMFPPQSDILEISLNIAVHVAELAFDRGLAQVPRPADIKSWIREMLYLPVYPEYVK